MADAAALHDSHRHSSWHRREIAASTRCGCFHCGWVFGAPEVDAWVDSDEQGVGQTALCPRCGIDSVIGDASGLAVADDEWLEALRRFWFDGLA
jgi:hypothetical protein